MKKNQNSGLLLLTMTLVTAAAFFAGNRYQVREIAQTAADAAGAEDVRADAAGNEDGRDAAGKVQDSAGTGAKQADAAGAGIIPETEPAAAREEPPLPVTAAEEELLASLWDAMSRGERESAARILNDNEEQFKVLTEKSLDGRGYLFYQGPSAGGNPPEYRMKEMTEENGGTGLVLKKFNTAFYGDFTAGKPNGKCLAIQTVILDFPRYTFAAGEWTDGKMNGEGTVGYRYYDGKPDGSFALSEKTGTFADNLMEGPVVYMVDNGSGKVLHWDIESQAGVTVLDGGWTYYSYKGEYMLPSKEDRDRAYVIAEDTKDDVRWNNLILWAR